MKRFCALLTKVHQPQTLEVSFNLSLRLCNIPSCKSFHNSGTCIQTKIFIEMRILKPSV